MKKLLKKIFSSSNTIALINSLVTSAIGFISFMLIARILAKEDFGKWAIYITTLTMAEMIRSGIIHTAIVRFASGKDRERYIGAGWHLMIKVSIVMALVVLIANILFYEFWIEYHIGLFFQYYPIVCLITLPFMFATWVLQADQKFNQLFFIKLVSVIPFLLVIIFQFISPFLSLNQLVWYHTLSFLIASLFAVVVRWSGLQYIKKGDISARKELSNFGKYSIGTLIGTNLLKSSDTYLIGWLIGPIGVAIYQVPLKLTEMMEIPVRAFASTALPKLSRASLAGNTKEVKSIFLKYTGLLTLMLLPIIIICNLLAAQLVVLIGGQEYMSSYIILQIFTIPALFLPIDRFVGITLDSLNMPKFNLMKVSFMVVVNIIGDILVIHFIGELWAVALVTILTVLSGVLVGCLYLNRMIKINYTQIIPTGIQEISGLLNKKFSTENNG